jgi:hypothetical protein
MTISYNEGGKGVPKEMHTNLVCLKFSIGFSKIKTLAMLIEKKNHQFYQIVHKFLIFCIKVSPCLWSKMFANLLLEKEGQERTFAKKGRI